MGLVELAWLPGLCGFRAGINGDCGRRIDAWQRFTEGLLFIIIGLLAILVILKATEGWRQ